MTDVWLAEKSSLSSVGSEIPGIFSAPEKAMQVCQDDANAYFGAERTPPLEWFGDNGYRSASYIHPCDGNFLFQVTRVTLDKKEEP